MFFKMFVMREEEIKNSIINIMQNIRSCMEDKLEEWEIS